MNDPNGGSSPETKANEYGGFWKLGGSKSVEFSSNDYSNGNENIKKTVVGVD